MTKTPSWNTALEGNEDWKAATSSEVFCNYVKIVEAKPKFLVPLNLSTSTLINQDYIDAAKAERDSFEPATREWVAFNSFVKKLQERLDRQEEMDRPIKKTIASLTVPESTDFDYDAMLKCAEAEAKTEKEESKSEMPDEETPHDAFVECNYKELYETGAGESSFIDIGLTNETEKLMEDGIDYVDVDTSSSAPAKEVIKEEPKAEGAETPDEKKLEEKDEIVEAEKALGLDLNVFYILRKMGK